MDFNKFISICEKLIDERKPAPAPAVSQEIAPAQRTPVITDPEVIPSVPFVFKEKTDPPPKKKRAPRKKAPVLVPEPAKETVKPKEKVNIF